jgi:hypothetical protein
MSSWGSTASVTRITSVYILVRPRGERTILTAAATTATTAIASVDILVRSRWERTIGTAAAAAASHGAREWREQSHADGRRRHTEYDAQSSCDHCRPPLVGDKSKLPQPTSFGFGRRPSRLWIGGATTASDCGPVTGETYSLKPGNADQAA